MIQATQAMMKARTVKGTAIRSAVLTTAAREDWAERTRLRIRWYWESLESCLALIRKMPEPLTAPDMIWEPS